MLLPNDPFAVFVDGPNFHHTARALHFDVDYKRLLETLRAKGRLLRASYFTQMAEGDDHIAIRPLLDWMQYNGWHVATTPARVFEDDDGNRRLRGSADIQLAVSAMKLAPAIRHAVLCTGNRDFLPLLHYLQDLGIGITLISSLRTATPMVSDELRRQADAFIELDTLRDTIARTARQAMSE
ncbi:uncharacterized LabA/DUF88 family protein [Rubricella aquisinus]|uniref:Uncharacterized LabA/DUF88 family protein n=1 Tax=Rubricella aquisinus TaxID=2028108 RepID=A0A840WZC5_9RHOB|nr:NYN domain-containing protein [Rubricella aquisinus]MBB5515794.1 uncharacterized LabA/DUF88 family protein [Rubricella aquisinus]